MAVSKKRKKPVKVSSDRSELKKLKYKLNKMYLEDYFKVCEAIDEYMDGMVEKHFNEESSVLEFTKTLNSGMVYLRGYLDKFYNLALNNTYTMDYNGRPVRVSEYYKKPYIKYISRLYFMGMSIYEERLREYAQVLAQRAILDKVSFDGAYEAGGFGCEVIVANALAFDSRVSKELGVKVSGGTLQMTVPMDMMLLEMQGQVYGLSDYISEKAIYLSDLIGDSHLDEVEKDVVLSSVSENTSSNDEIRYIDDYRKLNKLANDKGYVLNRSNGDHGIFKNKDGDIVVIPQGRTIGKGLSHVIQKSLYGID